MSSETARAAPLRFVVGSEPRPPLAEVPAPTATRHRHRSEFFPVGSATIVVLTVGVLLATIALASRQIDHAASGRIPTQEPWAFQLPGSSATSLAESNRDLRAGSNGTDVLRLQTLLAGLGYDPGAIDGYFGAATTRAVVALQTAVDLDPDGVVGSETWDAIEHETRRPRDFVASAGLTVLGNQ